MKKLFTILLSVAIITANTASAQESKPPVDQKQTSLSYGKKITADDAIKVSDMLKKLETVKEVNCKIIGTIKEVCQAEGCWLNLDKGDGTVLLVKMKGHSFVVAKNLAGKTAVIEGRAFESVTSVEQLQDYARDGGKSEKEVAAITQPKKQIVFEAEGVLVQ